MTRWIGWTTAVAVMLAGFWWAFRPGPDAPPPLPAVAKLEKRGDMHVGNLRRYVEALGGTLEITAHFADTTVVITNVGESP